MTDGDALSKLIIYGFKALLWALSPVPAGTIRNPQYDLVADLERKWGEICRPS